MLAKPGQAHAGCTAAVAGTSFPSLDVLSSTGETTTATLSFSCTGMVPAVPVTLCPNLDAGSGGGNGSGGRYLSSGSATLPFQIYQDSGYSQPWGSTSFLVFGSTPTITITPDSSGKASTTRTLYLQMSATSTAVPGTYSSAFANENFFYGLNLLSCAGITIGVATVPASFTFSVTVISNCLVTATIWALAASA